ncbi:MAG: hypothetical protein A2504_09670 [Bdellovibrionales bacterium RIFOXYD12_FULL_39_22]|nr:MAG: hypothetical protein A2385_13160 [Bdellovibrionales bacterium RIFOXYB1_FULL_39_21]OFZ40995.1 MAG: hypothetical protein A2485_16670 [Bdellovibrionales bacterium RIFOXYC12_FULL_39_17]OFZ44823.1 MAG: hypothetical protein A2404_09960 [Bdellovibrionales bacterium RIFOXYC1_FULL_39_130]OFZ74288.1 MAG: hypothetical protein A2560_16925 [Bdellovibrionales bacterium RIFOXYD1_FULL_39_84]OFZ92152.1 MAG: hypothetical protein A2504_09670 [Bdellovibrionales bacterium RIFOXYD12_FULL_39_22]HLE12744.1 hy
MDKYLFFLLATLIFLAGSQLSAAPGTNADGRCFEERKIPLYAVDWSILGETNENPHIPTIAPDAITTSPAIVKKSRNIVVGAGDKLHFFSSNNTKPIKVVKLDSMIYGTPLVDNEGVVTALTEKGTLYFFDDKGNEVYPKIATGKIVRMEMSPSMDANGTILFGANTGMSSIRDSGEIISVQGHQSISSRPLPSVETPYYALELAAAVRNKPPLNMSRLLPASVTSSIAIGAKGTIVCGGSGVISVLPTEKDPFAISISPTSLSTYDVIATPAIDEDANLIVAGDGEESTEHHVLFFNFDGKSIASPFKTSNRIYASPTLASKNKKVIVADMAGIIYIFNYDGSLHARYNTDASTTSTPVMINDNIFALASDDGVMRFFDLDGNLVGEIKNKLGKLTRLTTPTLDEKDGSVIIGDKDGYLHSFKLNLNNIIKMQNKMVQITCPDINDNEKKVSDTLKKEGGDTKQTEEKSKEGTKR